MVELDSYEAADELSMDDTSEAEELAAGYVVTGEAVGTTPDGQAVMIAGFSGTYGAQIPWKYEAAAWVSLSSPDHDSIQAMTLVTYSESLQ